MLIIHHYDLDGHCSAAIIKYLHPVARCYEMNYEDEIPWEDIKDNIVYIVDFSFGLEDMKRVMKEAKQVIWIDHHVSAIKDLKSISNSVLGSRDIEETYSGCELTWKYIFPNDPMPRAVHLLGRYDVHDYADPETIPFEYAMMSKDTNPETCMNLWVNLFNNQDDPGEFNFWDKENLVEETVEEGKPMQEFVEKMNVNTVKNVAVTVLLEGHKFLAVNSYLINSNALEKVFQAKKWDAMMVFYRKSGGWSVSIYNGNHDGVDCVAIAKKFGGGGHKDAAGFFCKKLPFEV